VRDRGVLLNDVWVRVVFVLIVLSCVLTVTFVLLMEARGELVGWFYFATVDYQTVWGFGPFGSFDECWFHREYTVPINVEATACGLMDVGED
jgi:hypothetical protein